ncbi:MAG: mfd, partial [Bacilli bacterium]|nr:mfd [Bacilli bacterium]
MEFWKDSLKQDSEFQSLEAGIAMGFKEMMVTGISGSARHLYMGGLISARKNTVVLITASVSTAQQAVDDLTELLPDRTVLLFPEREMSFLDILAYSPEQAASRLKVLERLAAGEPTIVVTPIGSVYQPITPLDQFRDAAYSLKVGQLVEMSKLIEHLVYLGYERVELVETKGEFTVRGGIIDVYPLTSSEAVRIEFFDDEVDSIRLFDVQTQRSLEKLTHFTLWPIREMIANSSQFHAASVKVEAALKAQLNRKHDQEYKTKLEQHIGMDLEKLQQGIFFPGLLRYGKWLYEETATLLSYCEDTVLFIDEPTRLREVARVLEREALEGEAQALERGEAVAGMLPRFDRLAFMNDRQYVRLMWSLFARQVPGTTPQRIINIQARQMQSFHGQMPLLKSELDRYRRTGYRIVFLAADGQRAERLKRILEDFGMEAEFARDPSAVSNRPAILQGNLHNGFELSLLRLAVITETEVFTTKQRKIRPNRSISDAERIKSYQELKIGDYVVHLNHGIGKYIGITTLVVENTHRDYLQLEYANGDSLYVPTDQID